MPKFFPWNFAEYKNNKTFASMLVINKDIPRDVGQIFRGLKIPGQVMIISKMILVFLRKIFRIVN